MQLLFIEFEVWCQVRNFICDNLVTQLFQLKQYMFRELTRR